MVVEGRVWEIPSGRGLGGICVSNGDHIVQTDTEGRYALEIEPGDHRFVCLTVPDGFRSEGDFYRSTLGWMGPQQDVDFGLVPAPERAGQTFSVAHLADTHVGGYGDSKPLGRVVARDLQQLVEDAAPDLIVVCGDLTDWGTPPELNSYREAIRTVSTPVFSLFGGHDGNKERFGDLTIEELVELKSKREYAKIQEIVKKREGTTFTRNFEQALGPAYYSFDWGGRHFVLNPTESFFSPADERRKDSWFEADLELHRAVLELRLAQPLIRLKLVAQRVGGEHTRADLDVEVARDRLGQAVKPPRSRPRVQGHPVASRPPGMRDVGIHQSGGNDTQHPRNLRSVLSGSTSAGTKPSVVVTLTVTMPLPSGNGTSIRRVSPGTRSTLSDQRVVETIAVFGFAPQCTFMPIVPSVLVSVTSVARCVLRPLVQNPVGSASTSSS